MDDYETVLVGLGMVCIVGARAARFLHDASAHLLLQTRVAYSTAFAWVLCGVCTYALFYSWKHESMVRRTAEPEAAAARKRWMTSREQWIKVLVQAIVAQAMVVKSDRLLKATTHEYMEKLVDPGLSTVLAMAVMTVYLVSDDNVGFLAVD